jgi:hypothetical protein
MKNVAQIHFAKVAQSRVCIVAFRRRREEPFVPKAMYSQGMPCIDTELRLVYVHNRKSCMDAKDSLIEKKVELPTPILLGNDVIQG